MSPPLLGSLENIFGRTADRLANLPLLARLLSAALLTGLAAAARGLLESHVDGLSPYATFYPVVEFSALLGGLSAGLLATIFGAAAACLWFGGAVDFSLGLFVTGCALFSMLADVMRQAWMQSIQDRGPQDARASHPTSQHISAACDPADTTGRTAAALAHEINQPLTAIVTYLKVARRLLEKTGPAAPDVLEVLEKANEQTLRAGRIVTSLRDLVQRREPDKTLVAINALIDETIKSPETNAACASGALTLEITARFDRTLVDREQIREVILRLARRALETRAGAEPSRLTISTSNPDDHTIRVDMFDAGHGLPDSCAGERIGPFETMETNEFDAGLSISRSIIEKHEGQIWATVDRNGGAVYGFILPLAESEIDS